MDLRPFASVLLAPLLLACSGGARPAPAVSAPAVSAPAVRAHAVPAPAPRPPAVQVCRAPDSAPATRAAPRQIPPAAATAFAHDNLALDRALSEVRDTGKPGLFYFCADWCGFCSKFEQLTLSRPDVQHAIRTGFVGVAYDVDTPAGRQAANKYGATGYPTLVVVGTDGEARKSIVGFRGGPDLLGALGTP